MVGDEGSGRFVEPSRSVTAEAQRHPAAPILDRAPIPPVLLLWLDKQARQNPAHLSSGGYVSSSNVRIDVRPPHTHGH